MFTLGVLEAEPIGDASPDQNAKVLAPDAFKWTQIHLNGFAEVSSEAGPPRMLERTDVLYDYEGGAHRAADYLIAQFRLDRTFPPRARVGIYEEGRASPG